MEQLKNRGNGSGCCRTEGRIALQFVFARTKVAVSAICHRLIVVSRGWLLRPIVSTVVPLCWTTASGLAVFASPGSRSLDTGT